MRRVDFTVAVIGLCGDVAVVDVVVVGSFAAAANKQREREIEREREREREREIERVFLPCFGWVVERAS